jgi:phospholipid/cholesterol/gamma-HCH transport system permease protein
MLAGQRLEIDLAGDWMIGAARPALDEALAGLAEARSVCFDAALLGQWDSLLLTSLVRIIEACKDRSISVDLNGLPEGARGLLELAQAVPERQGARRSVASSSVLEQVGKATLAAWAETLALMSFTGEACLSFVAFLRGRARYRKVDLWLLIQECGIEALPIVTLISLLVGLILAFVGAVQLQLFGAQVYIADLVGLGMSREMGAMMTAIILAGRTGAAFAAQLGAMRVNNEIDALKTLGLSEMEFLVLPRMLALILMTPLLCIFADLMGIIGGALVSIGLFDISILEYAKHTQDRLDLTDFAIGIGKSSVFGVLIALSGCMKGMQCGNSSSAVGLAATSAVVTGIVMIVVSDAVMTLILTALRV